MDLCQFPLPQQSRGLAGRNNPLHEDESRELCAGHLRQRSHHALAVEVIAAAFSLRLHHKARRMMHRPLYDRLQLLLRS